MTSGEERPSPRLRRFPMSTDHRCLPPSAQLTGRHHQQCGPRLSRTLFLLVAVALFCGSLFPTTTATNVASSSAINPGEVVEYCQADLFTASCRDDQVIVMQSAVFGRMKQGRCVKGDYGHLGCSKDVLAFMDSKCSGSRECKFRVFDSGLLEQSPCPEDIASYLEASYTCVDVVPSDRTQCHQSQPVLLTAPAASIASVTSQDFGLGTSECPWTIRVASGQRVAVSLRYFDVLHSSTSTPTGGAAAAGGLVGNRKYVGGGGSVGCYELATVRDSSTAAAFGGDSRRLANSGNSRTVVTAAGNPARTAVMTAGNPGGDSRSVTTCDGRLRGEHEVYRSTGNELTVQIVGRMALKTLGRFVLSYHDDGVFLSVELQPPVSSRSVSVRISEREIRDLLNYAVDTSTSTIYDSSSSSSINNNSSSDANGSGIWSHPEPSSSSAAAAAEAATDGSLSRKKPPTLGRGSSLFFITTIGCADMTPQFNTTMTRDGDRLTVKCNRSEHVWYLVCANSSWIGDTINCNNAGEGGAWKMRQMFDVNAFPYGILIVVAIGVALGVFCGGLLLACVVIYMKRDRDHVHRDDQVPDYQISVDGYYPARRSSLDGPPPLLTASEEDLRELSGHQSPLDGKLTTMSGSGYGGCVGYTPPPSATAHSAVCALSSPLPAGMTPSGGCMTGMQAKLCARRAPLPPGVVGGPLPDMMCVDCSGEYEKRRTMLQAAAAAHGGPDATMTRLPVHGGVLTGRDRLGHHVYEMPHAV